MLQFRTVATILFALSATPIYAETNGVLRIGVLNDMSSVYADFQGPGSVIAAQLAIEDFNKQSKRKVEVISGDHQNKPDIGAGIARRWLDVEGVDMIVDLPNSAVALAVGDIVREKNKVAIGSGAGTALLTGARCSPNFVHWTYDTWAMRRHEACSLPVPKHGSSSLQTTRSGTISRSRRAKKCWRAAGRSSEACATRSVLRISRLSCCRRRHQALTSSLWQMPAATPPTASNRRPSSRSAANRRSLRSSSICKASRRLA